MPGSPAVTAGSPRSRRRRMWLLALVGPGLMVMLADTDAGSVITAAQSGARYGYALVGWQVALIPLLYVVQEITARLGLVTGAGHGTLIRASFGTMWALVSAVTLFVACLGALVTEFAGVAGTGELAGLPRWVTVTAAATLVVGLVLLGRYRRVEHVGIAIGALELLFIPAAVLARPHSADLWHGLTHPLRSDPGYLRLLAANVGATIMPWMVFYQQEAVIDKGHRGLNRDQALRSARADTAVGAIVCQLITIAIIVAVAATAGTVKPGTSLTSVADIADGLAPVLGGDTAVVLLGLGMAGAALVAALVVALAGAWGVAEVLGWRHSLNDTPRHAARFYGLAIAAATGGAILVLAVPDLIDLSVQVNVMNACLLPIVLGFLLTLERRALPPELRMRGARRVFTYLLAGLVIAFGLYTTGQIITGTG